MKCGACNGTGGDCDAGPDGQSVSWYCPTCGGSGEYPPCKRCNGPNDLGELCVKCAEETRGFDYEAAGAWNAQR